MLDRASNIFLKFLSEQPGKYYSYYEDVDYPDSLGDKDSFLALTRYLESLNYIEYIKSTSGAILGVRLSHVGTNRREFSRMAFKAYLKDKWIDILALTIAAIALIVSIIALSKPPQVIRETQSAKPEKASETRSMV